MPHSEECQGGPRLLLASPEGSFPDSSAFCCCTQRGESLHQGPGLREACLFCCTLALPYWVMFACYLKSLLKAELLINLLQISTDNILTSCSQF